MGIGLSKLKRKIYAHLNRSSAEQLNDFFNTINPITTEHELIRVGGDGDGGYLIPNDIDSIDACFSPGVADSATFEQFFAAKGVKCFLADYSVDTPPARNELFDFEKKYLGVKEEGIFITLENWIARKAKSASDLILQMDIEGAEYDIIPSTPNEILKKFRIIVIEMHALNEIDKKDFLLKVNTTFQKLLMDFEIVHIHQNNCIKPTTIHGFEVPPVIEFTFLRKNRINKKEKTLSFPHALDKTNAPWQEDFPLPKCWYSRL